jgi:hypothetical protein
MNPAMYTNSNSTVRNEIRALKAGPRSVKISILKPPESSFTIMLDPNAVTRERRSGIARSRTRIKRQSQTIRIPLLTLRVLIKPDLREFSIVIWVIIKRYLRRTG